ncbi:MAG: electron transfer flavoprotein subunit beta/FixA family protein [Chloroflexi bacterium]|nr:electron transfer flavoprotein subunit beta/FixA family protein [Chloroflexota bacterium]
MPTQIVLVKQVPDPETPSSQFRVDPVTNKVVPATGIAPVISPFDEQAAELALRIKDKQGGKVIAISIGPDSVKDVVKHVLAMGADEGYIITGPEVADPDASVTAYVLAQAIKKIGLPDIIYCGRQAADFDQGQVGIGVASLLGIPHLLNGQSAVVDDDGNVVFERVLTAGIMTFKAKPPVLLSASQETGQPRYPTLRNIMAAAKKPITTWSVNDIGCDPARVGQQGRRARLTRLFVPVYEGQCEVIEGENAADAGRKLALALREAKII